MPRAYKTNVKEVMAIRAFVFYRKYVLMQDNVVLLMTLKNAQWQIGTFIQENPMNKIV